jgi:hypothetical protein
MRAALDRALKLFDLTVADPRFVAQRPDVLRCREVVCDFLVGDNLHRSTLHSVDTYFLGLRNVCSARQVTA